MSYFDPVLMLEHIKELEAALLTYGDHTALCSADVDARCDCGWIEWRRNLVTPNSIPSAGDPAKEPT